MPDLVKLLEQWAVVTAAPIPFAIAVVVAGGLIWLAVGWSYSGVLASKNAQIELQDRQLADYKQKLDGASPDQAKAKIEALEKTIRLMVGERWEPLNKPQIAALASKLKDIKKSRASIMYENALCKEMAQSIFDAFKLAGWDEAVLQPGTGLGDGIVVGWSSRAVEIKTALEATATLPVWAKDTEKEIPDLVIVGVGLNSHQTAATPAASP
jgi:hypothetical protein